VQGLRCIANSIEWVTFPKRIHLPDRGAKHHSDPWALRVSPGNGYDAVPNCLDNLE
jgi:hypothetical protein